MIDFIIGSILALLGFWGLGLSLNVMFWDIIKSYQGDR